MTEKGYIHVYTGGGQGKTTAAFGLALRAAGAGKKVFIGQFVKSIRYNEVLALEHCTNVLTKQYGQRCFIENSPAEEDVSAAREGWAECREVMKAGEYGLVVLDELTIALHYRFLEMEGVMEGLRERDPSVEIVITGRYAPRELVGIADLVTDMHEIKHYYTQGVLSREGFDK